MRRELLLVETILFLLNPDQTLRPYICSTHINTGSDIVHRKSFGSHIWVEWINKNTISTLKNFNLAWNLEFYNRYCIELKLSINSKLSEQDIKINTQIDVPLYCISTEFLGYIYLIIYQNYRLVLLFRLLFNFSV